MSKDQIKEMRQDLIEIFDEEYEKRRVITADFTAEKMSAKGYRKQEWISVSERLPDGIGDFLVVVKMKYSWEKEWEYDVDVATYDPTKDGYIDHWNTWNDWREGQECYITHWMPLPEAPRKEDEGK